MIPSIHPTSPSADCFVISDDDNPLIDRKYPAEPSRYEVADNAIKLPQIYRFDYSQIPDFTTTTMSAISVNDDMADIPHTIPSSTQPNVTAANPTLDFDASNDKPTTQTLSKKIDTKTLSSRQAIAQAKQQAKAIERQKSAEEQQRQAEAAAEYERKVAEALANPQIHDGLLHQRKSIAQMQAIVKQHAIFGELAQDLQTIVLPDNQLSEQTIAIYHKAVQLLSKADIQPDTPTQPFDDLTTLTKAVAIIDKFADNGIADAMLRKALWLFEGNALFTISQNTPQALQLIEQAANQQEPRAEKLLSKLYYAGHVVPQDNQLGKYWLEQAAAHGHEDALRITQGIATMSLLQQTQQQDNLYLKKLAIGFIMLIILMLGILVFVKV